ncbi:restriction endonuclease subunit S [Methylobacterium komagatae]
MIALPEGWSYCKIIDLAERIFDGPFGSNLATSDYTDSGVLVARLENVSWLKFNREKETFISDEKFYKLAHHELQAGDILIGSFVDNRVRVCLVPDNLRHRIINKADVFCVRSDRDQVDAKYVLYKLASPAIYQQLSETAVHGATRPRIKLSDLKKLSIGVPPLPEQRRIVAKIDDLTFRSKQARDDLERVPTLIVHLKERILEQAFKGDLTSDWRAAHCAADWTMIPLQDVLSSGPSNGWSPPSGDDATGAQTLKLTATTSGRLRLDPQAVKRIYETPPPESRYWLKPNDILIQRANALEYVGIAAIFDGPPSTYIYPDLMMRIRASDPGATKFLWLYLSSPAVRTYFRAKATGTSGNMPKINGETVRTLLVPNVSAPERDEIVRRIERALAAIDRLAAEVRSAWDALDKLDQAILAKAFRGELVPQDPNDEPASVLLERIRAERAAAGPAPKRGRRARGAVA